MHFHNLADNSKLSFIDLKWYPFTLMLPMWDYKQQVNLQEVVFIHFSAIM